jgi:hypothetical protein
MNDYYVYAYLDPRYSEEYRANLIRARRNRAGAVS